MVDIGSIIGDQQWTDRARKKLIGLAWQEACRFGHSEIYPIHLLAAALMEGTGVAAAVLRESFVLDVKSVRLAIAQVIPAAIGKVPRSVLPFAQKSQEVIAAAHGEAQAIGHDIVGTEHLLLALMASDDEGLACVMKTLKLDPVLVRQEVLCLLGVMVTLLFAKYKRYRGVCTTFRSIRRVLRK